MMSNAHEKDYVIACGVNVRIMVYCAVLLVKCARVLVLTRHNLQKTTVMQTINHTLTMRVMVFNNHNKYVGHKHSVG